MNVTPVISYHNLDSTPTITEAIEKHFDRLRERYPGITACHVAVEIPHRHQRKGRRYSVSIDVHLPQRIIGVGRDPGTNEGHEDAHVAVRDAFRAAVRQLAHTDPRKRRRQRPAMTSPLEGVIVRWHRRNRFGFIRATDGHEVFFTANSYVGDPDEVRNGQHVRFDEAIGTTGPHATSVITVKRSGHRDAATLAS